MLPNLMKAWSALLFTLTLSLPAAAVTQPDGTVIPTAPGCDGGQPTGLAAVFSCICEQPGVCNIGVPCASETSCDDGQNGTCETTMWHEFNDNTCIPSNMSGLDPQTDANIVPETFSPVCPMTFTVESRGTAMFRDIFGWYNVTSSEPSADDLHVMLDCDATVGEKVVLDINSEPDYLGGEIGFFLASPESSSGSTCGNGDCCATIDRIKAGEGHVYYSQPLFNPDASGAQSQIHLLVYDSQIFDHKFYFAWEDIFGGSNNDFTDLVTSVGGIECSGGGLPCDTGEIGMCAYGVTECNAVGDLVCTQIYTGTTETCDAVDNDCDGEIDDDATCTGDAICHNGRCVNSCTSGEFPCKDAFTVCDFESGLCVPENCVDVNCNADEVCRDGACVSPCDGVTCPWGQTCIGDVCVNPCDGVSCATGQVCRGGTCFDGCGQCSGASCEAPLRCDTGTGECYDPSCDPGCAAGQHCDNGSCVSDCDGAVCPGNAACVDGACQVAGTDQDGGVDPEAGAGGSAGSGGGPLVDAGADAATEGGANNPYAADETDDGCGCRAAGTPAKGGMAALAALALGMLFARRRRDS
jgi:MYXO-CTERM domain-containing protein